MLVAREYASPGHTRSASAARLRSTMLGLAPCVEVFQNVGGAYIRIKRHHVEPGSADQACLCGSLLKLLQKF